MPSWWDQWGPLILTGAGAGANLIGSNMASGQIDQVNQQNQQNTQWLQQQAAEEKQRRDVLTKMFMPAILKNMGYRNPRMLQQLMGSPIGAQQPPEAPPLGGGGGGDPAQDQYARDMGEDPWGGRYQRE